MAFLARCIGIVCLITIVQTCRPSLVSAQDSDAEIAVMRHAAETIRPSLVRLDVTGLDAPTNLQGRAVTTGLVVSEDGWIVSSAYGFTDDPEVIFATFDHGERSRATIVAKDSTRKIVLLKAESKQRLVVPEFVGLQDVKVGQTVVAVGRVLARDAPNLSLGIISARYRIWGKALQSDAKISPNNYGGPLCDWRGRVVGVLVPLSPQSDTDTAGSEWYDSGIGFAIPSEAILDALPRLAEGKDLHAGVLGIRPDTMNLLAGPVKVGSCLPRSPADQAGIRVGDLLVRVNGQSIARYADLRHALGPLYAGDVCNVEIEREGERLSFQVTLVDRIPPFEHGYLGVLPNRWPPAENGVTIRDVYPNTPAAELGLQTGDTIQSIGEKAVDSIAAAHRTLAGFQANDQTTLTIIRNGESIQHTVRLGEVPQASDRDRSSAYDLSASTETLAIDDVQTLKLPEEAAQCWVRTPHEFHADVPHALLMWVDRPGVASAARLEEQWGAICDAYPLIVMTPESANGNRWNPTDADFVRRCLEAAMQEYPIDDNLVVVGGFQSGGSLAMMVAMQSRETVRGIATVDAIVVPQVLEASNEPLRRLSFLLAVSKQDRLGLPTVAARDQLRQAHFPVEFHELQPPRDELNDQDRMLIRDWIDQLDRF